MARTKKDYDRWGTPKVRWVSKPKGMKTTKSKSTTKTKKVKRG